MQQRELLSIAQAMARVGVSRRSIYNWLSAGKLEYVRTAGGSIRIFADTLWQQPTSQPQTTWETVGRG
jgi:excisionase family DNA binding protein